jgi:hypothetical protein
MINFEPWIAWAARSSKGPQVPRRSAYDSRFNFRVVVVAKEVSHVELRRNSAVGAVDASMGMYAPEIIKESFAFRILAVKLPKLVFRVSHRGILSPSAWQGRSLLKD